MTVTSLHDNYFLYLLVIGLALITMIICSQKTSLMIVQISLAQSNPLVVKVES